MSDILQQLNDSIAIVAENKRLRAQLEAQAQTIAAKDRRIAALEGQRRRETLPFKRDQTQRI
jgi:hypothetical protein